LFSKYRLVFQDHKKLEKKKTTNPEIVNKIPEGLEIPKLKQDLKFVSELTCLGLLPVKSGLGIINFIMKEITVENEGKQKEGFIDLILHLCKNIGDDIFGLVPEDKKSDMVRSDLIDEDKQKIFKDILSKYYAWR